MSSFDVNDCTPWTDNPGLYAAFNIDGQTALDEGRDREPKVIHGWEYGESLVVSNVNQQWQLASIGDKKWLIINKKTGDYLSAKTDSDRVTPQTGDADYSSAHWRITLADQGDPFRIYIQSVKHNGSCLALSGGASKNETPINCATQNKSKKGQVWALRKLN